MWGGATLISAVRKTGKSYKATDTCTHDLGRAAQHYLVDLHKIVWL